MRKLNTAKQMRAAIDAIVEKRSIEANESQYDRKVCILAVSAAGDAVRRVPVMGTAIEYGQAVAAGLGDLQNTYNDTDGEYTSGRGPICDVYYDVLERVSQKWVPVLGQRHASKQKLRARHVNPIRRDAL